MLALLLSSQQKRSITPSKKIKKMTSICQKGFFSTDPISFLNRNAETNLAELLKNSTFINSLHLSFGFLKEKPTTRPDALCFALLVSLAVLRRNILLENPENGQFLFGTTLDRFIGGAENTKDGSQLSNLVKFCKTRFLGNTLISVKLLYGQGTKITPTPITYENLLEDNDIEFDTCTNKQKENFKKTKVFRAWEIPTPESYIYVFDNHLISKLPVQTEEFLTALQPAGAFNNYIFESKEQLFKKPENEKTTTPTQSKTSKPLIAIAFIASAAASAFILKKKLL